MNEEVVLFALILLFGALIFIISFRLSRMDKYLKQLTEKTLLVSEIPDDRQLLANDLGPAKTDHLYMPDGILLNMQGEPDPMERFREV